MEKILAGGANTDEKEIAAFEQKASFKIRVSYNANFKRSFLPLNRKLLLKFALHETPIGSAVSYSQLCCCALQAAATNGMCPKT